MPEIGDERVQGALHAILSGDATALQVAIDADPELVTITWGENTLLEWTTQPPHGVAPEVIDVLIRNGSALDRALNLAGCWNLAQMCTQLLAAGADPAARADADLTPLESAAMHGSTASADVLVAHGLHRPSLWLAAASGLLPEVQAWVDSTGQLMKSAGPYRPNLADVGHPSGPEPSNDPTEILAETFVFAAANGRTQVVDYLLEVGVNINAAPYRNTTGLHLAILFRNPDAVANLLDRGAATDLLDDRYNSDAHGWAEACRSDDNPDSTRVAELLGASA